MLLNGRGAVNGAIADWPQVERGWPNLTCNDPVIDTVFHDLFADADGPTIKVEVRVDDRDAALGGRDPLSWSIDGETQVPATLAEVLFRAVGLLNRYALDVDPERFHLHAALVGDATRTVLIPGVRGAGKTTLSSAMIERGWSYGTDEMVAVSDGPHGSIVATALAKPLNCKPGSLRRFDHVRSRRHLLLAHWPTERAQLGIAPRRLGRGPKTVTNIVVPQRSNRYVSPHLSPLESADAVRVLAENSFDFERYGAGASLELAARLVAGARTWRLLYRDAEDAAGLLDRELHAGGEAGGGSNLPEVVSISAMPDTAGQGGDRQLVQASGSLGVAIDGRGVIWVPATRRVLSASPPAFVAWASADGAATPQQRAGQLGVSVADLNSIDDELVQLGVLNPPNGPPTTLR